MWKEKTLINPTPVGAMVQEQPNNLFMPNFINEKSLMDFFYDYS